MQHFGGDAARAAGHQHNGAVGQRVARRRGCVDFRHFGAKDRPLAARIADLDAATGDCKLRKHEAGKFTRISVARQVDRLGDDLGPFLKQRFCQGGTASGDTNFRTRGRASSKSAAKTGHQQYATLILKATGAADELMWKQFVGFDCGPPGGSVAKRDWRRTERREMNEAGDVAGCDRKDRL